MLTMLKRQILETRQCEIPHCFPSTLKNRRIYTKIIIIMILMTLAIHFVSLMNTSTYVEPPDLPPQIYKEEYLEYVREAGLPMEAHGIPVLEFRTPVRGEDNIFFMYTTCVVMDESTLSDVTHELRMTYQQVCAVESAARMNPESKVYLFYTCPLDFDSLSESSVLIRRLFEYSNIHIWYQTLEDFFKDTPLENFYKSGRIQKSRYRIIHTSDVLRILALWKYGGIYLDLDFIITKSLDGLGKNFAGAETEESIANGAMGMSVDGVGEKVADACLEDLLKNFNGDIWAQNGPLLLKRVMQKICGVEKISLMTKDKCRRFQVHNVTVLYAVSPGYWRDFFTEKNSDITMAKVKNSYAVHLWNSMEKSMMEQKSGEKKEITSKRMFPGSKQPVALLREQYCPLVYSHIVLAEKIHPGFS